MTGGEIMIETLQAIATALSALLAVITAAGALIKPIRDKIVDAISDKKGRQELLDNIEQLNKAVKELSQKTETQQKDLDGLKEGLTSSIRDTILRIYFETNHKDSISAWESENIRHLFDAYKKLGGNSFVEDCVSEILEKPVNR